MRALYSLAWLLALPLVLTRLWWRGWREPGYRQHVLERLALTPCKPAPGSAPLLWVHAVSVGETRAAEPLIDALLAAFPSHEILLTHMTPTGRATGAALFGKYGRRVRQAYLPYDLGVSVRRFLRIFRPRLCILMETEIWPNLMAACWHQQIPVALVNARLSQRSLGRAHRLGRLIEDAARQLRCVGAQTETDAARIRSLGVANVHVTGSLKFDVTPPLQALRAGAQLRQQIGPRPVLLCASTREGEEAMIIAAIAQIGLPAATLLLLVPRHPQRFDQVAALVEASGLRLQRRSTLGTAPVDADVLLGDSMDEMFAYCAACDVAMVGGSLLPLGGQNPIEPCVLGKPVMFGLHTFNFSEICDAAIASGAALRVEDAVAMVRAAAALLADPASSSAMGRRAAAFAQLHGGATVHTMDLLRSLITA